MSKLCFVAVTVVLSSSVFAQSKLIKVPQDQPTIQAAIDSAANGDTVLVAEGTYLENLIIKKKIILASMYLLDKDTSHISKTIIDGSSPNHADSGSVVTFGAGTDTSSILVGFTITSGTGSRRYRGYPDFLWWGVGGGIYVEAGGAKILHNIIVGNVIGGTRGVGGGIAVWDLTNSNPVGRVVIEANIIRGNQILGADGSNGGGIFVSGPVAAEISNNIIAKNQSPYESGGIGATSNANLTLVNNTIVFNSSRGTGGGRFMQTTARMMNNIFWNPGRGAEIAAVGVSYVHHNLIRSNYYGENINEDPGITDTIGFTLTSGSPCISVGLDSASLGGVTDFAPTVDIYGNQRPNSGNAAPDLGAIESVFETNTPYAFVPQQWVKSMMSQGSERVYSLFLPKNYVDSPGSFPLVIALTGAGGTYEFGTGVGLQNVADTSGFVLVSPNPLGNSWYHGASASLQSMVDVTFISELLDSIIASYNIDTTRIYLCGLSSGAFMSFRAASHLSSRIAGIGVVAGTMPTVTARTNPPSNPVDVVMFHGTADAGVPWEGNDYRQSVDSTIIKWRSYNGCDETAVIFPFNYNPDDGTTVERFIYGNSTSGKKVVLYKIHSGAHNWPGVVHPFASVPHSMDVFASAEIIKFFTGVLSSVEEKESQAIPLRFSLSQNYPNPFNPSTKIQFSVVSSQLTVLKIYDLLGREVATLVNEELKPGSYEVTWDAMGYPSGVYFYRLKSESFVETRKLVLMR